MFNSLLNSSITGRTWFKIAVAEVFFLPLPNTEREVRTAVYPHGYCAIAVVVVVDTTTTAAANRPFACAIPNPNSDPNPNTDPNPKYNP